MKRRMRKYTAGILLAAILCMTAGCGSLQYDGQDPADTENEVSEETEYQPESQSPEPTKSPEPTSSPEPTKSPEPEVVEETACPSEEEIAALGIREDMLAYWLVLNNKKPFVSVNEDGQSFFWDQYFWFLDCVENNNEVYRFMVLDMDGDGKEEVVLECKPGTTDILHYEDGTVYGYRVGLRAMKRIHENGIYEGSDGASVVYYFKLTELNKDGYEYEMLAEMNDDYYEVEGKEVTEEKFYEYADAIESVELAERTDYTESMLEQRLLGELQEQEAALVRQIPAEKMVENEPDYQIHKEALQLYAKILSGEEEAIYVKGYDYWQWEDELTRMYFSLIDLDGDGVCELIFSCYFCTFQILHYREGKAYCYQFHPEDTVITTDGVFHSKDGYAKIEAFEEDGCRLKLLEDYDRKGREWVRYYYYSEDTMAQWLAEPEAVEETACPSEEEIAALGIREDMLAYWLVLNNKKPFVSADEGGQEFYWNQYFWSLSQPVSMFTVYDFGIVDLDQDGTEELVMVEFPEATQVLDYQDGKVYSYQFAFRGMAGITVDGVYSSSSAADIGGFHRINFDKGKYEVETLAYMEGDYYEVGGVKVSEEDFFAYTESFAKAKQIERIDFTEETLDEILLGDLEEEELYIVRHAALEEICDDNNPQKAAVPEAYLPVLTGKEKFICATRGGEKLFIDGTCIRDQRGEEVYRVLYFSMVDMEGDGGEEVVLTCDGITMLLHASEGIIYGYEFDFWGEIGIIANDGVFRRGYVDENEYKKIVSFDEDGCRMEAVENYAKDDQKRIQYYFYSEDIIAQWLE